MKESKSELEFISQFSITLLILRISSNVSSNSNLALFDDLLYSSPSSIKQFSR